VDLYRTAELLFIFSRVIRTNFIEKVIFFNYVLRKLGAGISQWYSAGLRAGRSGVRIPAGAGNFLFTTMSTSALGPSQPPIQWVPRVISLEVKRLGCEADQSPPSSAEVKNPWSYTCTPPIHHDVVLG
jgi:hypothetical protein